MPHQYKRLHDICVEFVHETHLAVLYFDGKTKFWVPKSAMDPTDGYIQVEDNEDGTITLTAPEYWLTEKGLL